MVLMEIFFVINLKEGNCFAHKAGNKFKIIP